MTPTPPSSDNAPVPPVPAAQGLAPAASTSIQAPAVITPQQALEALAADPVGFVKSIVDAAAQTHLYTLKEEAELRGALSAFRNANPDARRFEPFIMQEVAAIIQKDDDGAIAPWGKLLEQGLDAFRQKFKSALQSDPQLLEKPGMSDQNQPAGSPAFIEGQTNRSKPDIPATFTRQQIAKMSLDEFLKNEAAINDAMRNNRIR